MTDRDLFGGLGDLRDDRVVHRPGEHDRCRRDRSREEDQPGRRIGDKDDANDQSSDRLDSVPECQCPISAHPLEDGCGEGGSQGGRNHLDDRDEASCARSASVKGPDQHGDPGGPLGGAEDEVGAGDPQERWGAQHRHRRVGVIVGGSTRAQQDRRCPCPSRPPGRARRWRSLAQDSGQGALDGNGF